MLLVSHRLGFPGATTTRTSCSCRHSGVATLVGRGFPRGTLVRLHGAELPRNTLGHNPLAQLAMFLLFLLPLFVSVVHRHWPCTRKEQGIESLVVHGAFGWVFTVIR